MSCASYFLLIASLVLSLFSYVEAADTWILWNKARSTIPELFKDREAWQIKSAFDDKKHCVEELEAEANKATEPWRFLVKDGRKIARHEVNIKNTSGATIVTLLDEQGKMNNTILEEFLCLPDTVDPRNMR